MLGREQLLDDPLEHGGVGRHGRRRRHHARGRHRNLGRERRLLQPGVVTQIDRPFGLGHHGCIGAHEAFRHALDRGRLVVPFGVVADGLALDQRGMAPVDVRAALALVHRPGGAHDEDRRAIDVGVVDRHLGVQQPDQIVQDHRHRAAGRPGIAMRDLDRCLLVLTEQHLRLVAAVVDQGVVQPTKAGAGVHRHEGQLVALQQIDDDVGLVATLGHVKPPSVPRC